MNLRRFFSPLSLLPLLLGCSSEPLGPGGETFPAEPYVTVQSESGAVSIEVRTAPTQPPGRGLVTVDYLITGADEMPLDGVELQVVPWMPAMGHGASDEPLVEAQGEGHYQLSKVSLFMPGSWELRTKIAGPVEDSAIITFQIH
jgi:hypothetical protein